MVAELRLDSVETHSARLLHSVEYLLDCAGWELNGIQLVAAGIGPGSFTGIRIGVATALGLAQSIGVKFAGVSGLDALADQAAFVGGPVGVVMDAQRSQLYYAEYTCSGGRARRNGAPVLVYPSDLVFRLRRRHLYIVAAKSLCCLEDLTRRAEGWPRLVEADMFLASRIGKLALTRRRSWKSGNCLAAEPLYIRPPDATRPKDST